MLKVALTGGIATGKSHVLELFRRRGVPCLDTDELAHGVMSAGTEATAAIAARFGPGVLAHDGSVDRQALGPIVFADPAARRELEAIVHPAVWRAVEAGLRGFERLGPYPAAMVDVPLLFETGHQAHFDKVVVTSCPGDLQLARLRARGMTDTDARRRILAQWPTAEKTSRADFVIETGGTVEETDAQVGQIYRILVDYAAK